MDFDSFIDMIIKNQLKAIGGDYGKMGKEIKSHLSIAFEKYADSEGKLSYKELSKYGRLGKLKDEINTAISKNQTLIDNKIRKTGESVYNASYSNEMNTLQSDKPDLNFNELPPKKQAMKSVQNDLSGLTLNERLRGQRAGIIREINATLTQGLHNGESYRDMARRLTKTLEGDYVKATRIVRTEGHRVQEEARFGVINKISTEKPYKTMKWWDSTSDARLRDSHAYMGEKYSKDNAIPFDEEFVNDMTGGRGLYPGAMGVAEDDINCRCKLRTFIVPPDENILKEEQIEHELAKDLTPANEQLSYDLDESGRLNFSDKHYTQEWVFNPSDYVHDADHIGIDKAVTDYTRSGYVSINRFLRGKMEFDTSTLRAEKNARDRIIDLNAKIKFISGEIQRQNPLEEGKYLFRGIGEKSGRELATKKIGDILSDAAFQSFSTNPYTASSFSRNAGEQGRVVIRAITDGKIKGLAGSSGEFELILQAGQKWQIIGKEVIEGAREIDKYTIVTVYPM